MKHIIINSLFIFSVIIISSCRSLKYDNLSPDALDYYKYDKITKLELKTGDSVIFDDWGGRYDGDKQAVTGLAVIVEKDTSAAQDEIKTGKKRKKAYKEYRRFGAEDFNYVQIKKDDIENVRVEKSYKDSNVFFTLAVIFLALIILCIVFIPEIRVTFLRILE